MRVLQLLKSWPKPADADKPILVEVRKMCAKPPAELKSAILERRIEPAYAAEYPPPPIGERLPIAQELYVNRNAFLGKPEIEFAHFAMIVMLRRQKDTAWHFRFFAKLWEMEGDFLRQTLDSRWLVSACDTFADHAPQKGERATALAASILLNTIKIYETERLARGGYQNDDYWDEKWVPLFDGMNTYWVGGGDVVINLKHRIEALCNDDSPTSLILLELFKRICTHDTAYHRLREVHHLESTRW